MAKIGMQKNTKQTLKARARAVDVKTETDLRGLDEAGTNAEGALAFSIKDPSERLLGLVGAGFFKETSFYDRGRDALGLTEGDNALIQAAQEVAARTDGFASDVLKIAAFARDKLNVRTATQVLLAVAAHEDGTRALKVPLALGKDDKRFAHGWRMDAGVKVPGGVNLDQQSLVRLYASKICLRADEPRVALAAYEALFGELDVNKGYVRAKKHPNAFLRGLMDALTKFDAGLLLKYDTEQHPTFADLMQLGDFRKKGRRGRWSSAKWFYLLKRKLPTGICEGCGALFVNDNGVCERPINGKQTRCGGNIVPFDAEHEMPLIAARVKAFKRTGFDAETERLVKIARLTQENITSQWGSDARTWAYVARDTSYMNLLRNLRSILTAGAETREKAKKAEDLKLVDERNAETVRIVISKLTNQQSIAKARQFPYRYWSALRALGTHGLFTRGSLHADIWRGDSTFGKSMKTAWAKHPQLEEVRDGVVEAMERQAELVPDLGVNDAVDEYTAILVDLSGSMDNRVSSGNEKKDREQGSEISCREVAALFGAVAAKRNQRTVVVAFGESAQVRQVLKRDSVVSNMERIALNEQSTEFCVGHSTNAYLVPPLLLQTGRKFKRVIVLSDQQFWNDKNIYTGRYMNSDGKGLKSFAGEWEKFKRAQPDAWLHCVNLDHGHMAVTPLDRCANVNLLSGFSEYIFDMMMTAEARRKKVEVADAKTEVEIKPVEEAAEAVEDGGRKMLTLEEIRATY